MTKIDNTVIKNRPEPLKLRSKLSGEDRAFRGLARAAGLGTFVILVLIGLFLLLESIPAFRSQGWHFLTNTGWQLSGKHPKFGVFSALIGTIIIAIIALVVAIPVSIACALFINEYAPQRIMRVIPVKNFLTACVDLMAAVPSIISARDFVNTYTPIPEPAPEPAAPALRIIADDMISNRAYFGELYR